MEIQQLKYFVEVVRQQSFTKAAEVPDAIEPYLEEHDVMLLENHGALAVGSDIITAFYRMESLELWAKITINAVILGGSIDISRENIQKLMDDDTSLLDSDCTMFTRAWNRNSIATPVRIMTVRSVLRDPDIRNITPQATMAKANAQIITADEPRMDVPTPNAITSDAPNAAAIDTPRVYGSANGLSRTVCISAPAIPSAAPAISAVRA